MKKLALVLLLALFVQEGKSQLVWDSLGAGLPATSGSNRIWQKKDRIFSSDASLNTEPLREFSQGVWNTVISSSNGQVSDIVFDSLNDRIIILGKFGDLSNQTNSIACGGIAMWDLVTDSLSALSVGVAYPFEYTYQGMLSGSILTVVGRFQIISGVDTIFNIMNIDLLTGQYWKISDGHPNDLIRKVVLFGGDTVVAGTFVRGGLQFPLAKINSSVLDFSISGPFRGFAFTAVADDRLIFAGYVADTLGNQQVIGCFDGNNYSIIGQTNDFVNTLELFDGDLFAGGMFTSVLLSSNTVSVSSVARLRGTIWDDVSGGFSGGSISTSVRHIFATDDTIYFAGDFTQVGSVLSQNVARLVSLNTFFQEIQNQEFSIFPNPSDGEFTIGGLDEKTGFEIFDLSGKIVHKSVSLPKVVRLELPNGLYILKIGNRSEKLVIRK